MQTNVLRILGIAAISGSMFLVGCDKPSGTGQTTGAAIDKAKDNTINAANAVADKTVDVAKKNSCSNK